MIYFKKILVSSVQFGWSNHFRKRSIGIHTWGMERQFRGSDDLLHKYENLSLNTQT